MKLSSKEIQSISLEYGLGKAKSAELIEDGMINSNFILITDKGKFILRFLRKNASEKYIKERDLEFKVLRFLKKNNYPYKIPFPLKNKNRKIISSLRERKY